MPKSKAKNIAQAYVHSLRKHRFVFDRVYLYGSHASHTHKPTSDIDIAVVTRQPGRGQEYFKKKMQLWKLALDVDVHIEPILLSPDELQQSTASIMGDEVRKYGIRID